NSRYSRQFKIKFESTWNGNTDNAWENAANWNCAAIPDRYTDVVVPAGTVLINSQASCRSMRVNAAAAEIIVTAGHNLEVAQ
ncbi:MAG TPA: hypothetical protein PLZ68_19910, partial [Ferruginibacter sp.]|nr:hypothetical protein [Ferruginibacter sp.]